MRYDEVTVLDNANSNKTSGKTLDVKKIKEISKKHREKHEHKNIDTIDNISLEEKEAQTKKDDILLNAFKDRVIDSEHNISVRDIYSFYDQRRFGCNRSRVYAEKGRVTAPPSIAESLFVFKDHFN